MLFLHFLKIIYNNKSHRFTNLPIVKRGKESDLAVVYRAQSLDRTLTLKHI